jgi:hypothetical protein
VRCRVGSRESWRGAPVDEWGNARDMTMMR